MIFLTDVALVSMADLDSVNLDAEEWSSDISNVTSVLKLWLRELPDPLFTTSQHQEFMDAASEHMFGLSYDLADPHRYVIA